MRGRLPGVAEEGDVKVPIEGEDMIDEEAAQATEAEGAQEPVEPEAVEQDDEELERARVEAAIRAGEEAAERDMAADAARAREERDDLQKRLGDAEEQVEAAKREAADATQRLVRLQADWDNYRRRTAAERLAEKERAAEKLVCNLLPVIDDLERAIEHAGASEGDTQMSQFVDGVSAVHAKMLAVLAKEGVEPIDPAGEPFEPLSHQAVGRVENPEAYDETVAQVYQKGYRMGDKVIRTAMVTVTFGGPKRPAEEPADDAGQGEAAEAAQAEEN